MIRSALTVATAALLLGGGAGRTQDKKAPPKSEKATVVSPAAQAVQDLDMGFRLAAYARKVESPEAMITAARIIGTTPVERGEEKLPDGVKAFDPVAEANGLIAEALKMPRVTDGAKALAATTRRALEERPRGASGGPRVYEGYIGPGGTRSYQIPFRIGELAAITVRNTDNSDLDLYVTCNRSGWSTNDRGASRDARVSFTVGSISTGGFTVRVVNYGTTQGSRYVLFTN